MFNTKLPNQANNAVPATRMGDNITKQLTHNCQSINLTVKTTNLNVLFDIKHPISINIIFYVNN